MLFHDVDHSADVPNSFPYGGTPHQEGGHRRFQTSVKFLVGIFKFPKRTLFHTDGGVAFLDRANAKIAVPVFDGKRVLFLLDDAEGNIHAGGMPLQADYQRRLLDAVGKQEMRRNVIAGFGLDGESGLRVARLLLLPFHGKIRLRGDHPIHAKEFPQLFARRFLPRFQIASVVTHGRFYFAEQFPFVIISTFHAIFLL